MAALAVTTLTALTAVAPTAAVAAPAGGQQTIAWAPCEGDSAVECGTLTVPVNWAEPDGPTFELAMAKRPASDPAARVGTLVVNPGGPGGSGVNQVLWNQHDDELRRHFDILGFDPRGVARSSPVRCSNDLLSRIPGTITSQADFDRAASANRAFADDCRRRSGPLYDHVDTLQTVQDIDAIRAAVGDEKLSFFGMSYGTLMAQQYADRYPSRVRAIVSDSNMDHSLGARGFAVTQAVAGQDTFNEFVAGCGKLTQCPLYGRDIRAFWKRLLQRAALGELPDPDDRSYQIKPAELSNFLVRALNYSPSWIEVAAELRRLDEGRPLGVTASSAGAGADDQEIEWVFQATLCQDWALGTSTYAQWKAIQTQVAQVAPDLPGAGRPQVGTLCVGLPAPNNPSHRITPRNAFPLLLVNSKHDPATGYEWAQNLAEQFGEKATLLTYNGWGHIAYGRTSCVDGAIDRYLIGQELPRRGTTCAAVPPYDIVSAGAQAGGGTGSAKPKPGPTVAADKLGRAPTFPEVRNERALPIW